MSDAAEGPGWWQASDGKWYAPESSPTSGLPSPPAQAASPRTAGSSSGVRPTFWVMIGAAVLVMLGSVTTWVTASVGIFSVSENGTSGDGTITLILGIATAASLLLYLWLHKAAFLIIPLVLFVALVGIMIYEFINITSTHYSSNRITISASVGFGVYLCLIGSIAGVVTWIVHWRQLHSVAAA